MDSLASLPVPEIIEETCFQHSFTQNSQIEDRNRLRPPKLRKRGNHDSNFNRSQTCTLDSTQAHAISFREDTSGQLSSQYDESSKESYFDQCFTSVSQLGEGSFGEVFKVLCKEDGCWYAVKMSKQFYRSEHYRQERLEEVRRYEQFSGHPNCLRFYRAWEEDDRLYMQMELCRENLARYAERCFPLPIPEEKIWNILLDLLLAVKSLHDRNLLHLDIKLENVLIANDGSCKLADFGLVIDVERAIREQATEGDSRYMAPEIMQGEFSKAADIFSLGIAILELSCYLKLPSNGPLWQQLRSGQLPQDFMKAISEELRTVIRQMMNPDPSERPSVYNLLSHQKLIAMLNSRKRWSPKKIFQFALWKSLHTTLMDSIKNLALNLLNFFRLKLLLSKRLTQNEIMTNTPRTPTHSRYYSYTTVASTPIPHVKKPNPFMMYTVDKATNFGLTYQSSPITNGDLTPINHCNGDLTPINHNNHNNRSRKDFNRSSFRSNIGWDSKSSNVSSGLNDVKMSSLCGKRLFDDASMDESD